MRQWDIIHSSCFLVGDKNLCHSFGIFAALRWELCQFHSLLLLPSAVIGSSSKGQNKLLFNFFFFSLFLEMEHQTGRSGTAFW